MSARSRAQPWFGPRPPSGAPLNYRTPASDDPPLEWVQVKPSDLTFDLWPFRAMLFHDLIGTVPSYSITLTGIT